MFVVVLKSLLFGFDDDDFFVLVYCCMGLLCCLFGELVVIDVKFMVVL